jgi:hypothetical protein
MLLLLAGLSLLAVVVLGVFVTEPLFEEPCREVGDAISTGAGPSGWRLAGPG